MASTTATSGEVFGRFQNKYFDLFVSGTAVPEKEGKEEKVMRKAMRERREMRKEKKCGWVSLPAVPSSPAEGREAGSGKGLRVGHHPGSFAYVEDPGSPREAVVVI